MFDCTKCGSFFCGYKNKKPKRCPKCHSRRWEDSNNRPYEKYDFSQMDVGDVKVIPWSIKEDGWPDTKKNFNVTLAAKMAAKNYGWIFSFEYPVKEGIKITRIM